MILKDTKSLLFHLLFLVMLLRPSYTAPKKYYFNADLISVTKASPKRDDSLVRCKYFGKCQGCQYQMLSYEDQLSIKQNVITNAYKHNSNLDPSLIPAVGETVGSPEQYNYRTKLTPHFEMPRKSRKLLHRLVLANLEERLLSISRSAQLQHLSLTKVLLDREHGSKKTLSNTSEELLYCYEKPQLKSLWSLWPRYRLRNLQKTDQQSQDLLHQYEGHHHWVCWQICFQVPIFIFLSKQQFYSWICYWIRPWQCCSSWFWITTQLPCWCLLWLRFVQYYLRWQC